MKAKNQDRLEKLISLLEDLEDTRIYYPGDEPWSAIGEIAGELSMFLREEYGIKEEEL